MPLDRIRAYVVPEAVTLPGRIPQREPELIFFSAAVEAVENLQPLNGVHGAAGGTKGRKVRGKVGFHTGKEAPGGIHIFSADGDGDELLLNNAVAIGGLVQKHLVVFLPVVVQTVPLHRHEDGLLKVDLAHAVVEDGDFCGGSAVQTRELFNQILAKKFPSSCGVRNEGRYVVSALICFCGMKSKTARKYRTVNAYTNSSSRAFIKSSGVYTGTGDFL